MSLLTIHLNTQIHLLPNKPMEGKDSLSLGLLGSYPNLSTDKVKTFYATLYCETGQLLLWNNGKLCSANYDIRSCSNYEYTDFIPQRAWCLPFQRRGRGYSYFIVQSQLLHTSDIHAEELGATRMDEQASAEFFFMREWSAEEPVAGLHLQVPESDKATPNQLREFHQLLGGCARDAFLLAHKLQDILRRITLDASDLKFTQSSTFLAF
ncbi:hypothetical protein GYMLUDRAFT_54353 [Collybiopsis luxurians FD-317 M1]|nr:hypothetical protein GYMLUDRAFT_54353 [Collybiopsis luxurians FD-317 M1]